MTPRGFDAAQRAYDDDDGIHAGYVCEFCGETYERVADVLACEDRCSDEYYEDDCDRGEP